MARTRRRPIRKRRLVSEHFRLDGAPKRKFANKTAALEYLVGRNERTKYHVYKCTFCGEHHIAKN